MSERTQETIGQVHPEIGYPRDAIHIAVASVIAGAHMKPGTWVRLSTADVVVPAQEHEKRLGIIDPYLGRGIRQGERCWLFLAPNSITGLRHAWTHPAFGIGNQDEDAKAQARAWIQGYLDGEVNSHLLNRHPDDDPVGYTDERGDSGNGPITVERILEMATAYLDEDAHVTFGGISSIRDNGLPDEFWNCYQVLTGRPVHEKDRGSFWSCSC